MRFFIVLCLCSLSLVSFANTEISFSPLSPICSTDSLTCDAILDYPFTIATADPNNLTITHQLSQNGSTPADDPFGQILGSYPNYYISGFYPIGTYQIHLTVTDTQGNIQTAEMPFEVVDCLAPYLQCLPWITAEIQGIYPAIDVDGDGGLDNSGVVVYATDLVDTSYTNCNDSLQFSINISSSFVEPNQDFLFIQCCDPGILEVEIYAWDFTFNPYSVQPDGSIGGPNYDFCETYIIVTDDAYGLCDCFPFSASLTGTISTEEDNTVANVEVEISGHINEFYITPTSGQYDILGLEFFYDYTITPSKDTNVLNGVSTFDLVLIQKHILGVVNLGSPYKLIAADVNNSGSVSTLDLISIRRLILNLDQEFAQVPSWRFVDASFEFPDPTDPWLTPFPEVISIDDLNSDLLNLDFVAIKMGDVNASANAQE